MGRKAVAFVTLCCLVGELSASGWAGPKPQKQRQAVGWLVLTCPVEGASFIVDEGKETEIRGKTPAGNIALPPGTHTIRVFKEGYLPFADVFDVAEGETTEVEADLVLYFGRLKVEGEPPPVAIQVDLVEVGQAPIEIEVPAGEHVVRAKKAGFREEVRKVRVTAGTTTFVNFALSPEAAPQGASERGVIKTWWFWTVVGAVAVGVTMSALMLSRPKEKGVEAPYTIVAP